VIVAKDFKQRTAKRKAALVTEFLQGKMSVSESVRPFYLLSYEIETRSMGVGRGWGAPFWQILWTSKSNTNGRSKSNW
jgi:hypothetical protein